MNFEFSEEQEMLREQASRFLASKDTFKAVRARLDGLQVDASLWSAISDLGWPAVRIPEAYGGLGMGYLELCVLAEELGKALAPVPFGSSAFLAAETLIDLGDDATKSQWLPRIAGGDAVGCLAVYEGPGSNLPKQVSCSVVGNRLSGTKVGVIDGEAATFAIVAARDADCASDEFSLFLVDLAQPGVAKTVHQSLDPSRPSAELTFSNCDVVQLGTPGEGRAAVWRAYERAAVLIAFEQLGGAEAALDMAVAFVKERRAFGRAIGSFQAIKHKLADMYVLKELARSNCYYGAWALAQNAIELPIAAASARLAATEAFETCAAENMQLHGGMGFTWEADCHLYYRRAKLLSVMVEGPHVWRNRLIDTLQFRNAA